MAVSDPRPPAKDSPAIVYHTELYAQRLYLDRLRVHHLDLSRRVLEAGGLYSVDLLMIAAVSRSYSLVDGFLSAFDTWNPIVAAPIIRMQIDTLVRIAYTANAPRADDIADHVISGGEFRKLRDAEGKPLTDSRLLEPAEKTHPWLSNVYEATSGWVHFSPAHLHAAWKLTEREDERDFLLSGSVPLRPEEISLSALRELLGAMIKATEELFGYVEVWEARKGFPPGEIRDIRRPAEGT